MGIITKEWIDANDAVIQEKLQPLSDVKVVRTLDAVPSNWSGLLTYSIGIGAARRAINYKVGDEVRVPSEDSETGYTYYKLYAINNGSAVWQTIGGEGGDAILMGTIVVNLEAYANEVKTSGTELAGIVVTAFDGTTSTAKTLEAGQSSVTFKVIPTKGYTVSVSAVEGYATPVTQTIQNIDFSATETLTFAYYADEYTFNIQSNQTNDSTIGAVVGTVSYTGGSKTSHTSVKVAAETEVTVTFPDVTGYKKTATNVDKAYTVIYQTEVVTVNVLTDQDGVSAQGRTITINSIDYTVPANGTVNVKVPSDTVYSITASDWPTGGDKYRTPDVTNYASLTAASTDNAARSISLVYTLRTEVEISGYMIDQSDTDALPEDYIKDVNGNSFSGSMYGNDDDDVIHRIWSNTKLYAAATSLSNSKLQVRELSRSNKAQWSDGTYVVNNTTYDKFMKLPEFWWRCYEKAANTDQWVIEFSMEEQTGWNHWEGNIFIGIYKAFNTGNLVYSRANQTPTASVGWTNFRIYAYARGVGYSLVTYEMHCIMCLLGYGWLGTTDDQSIVGYGSSTYPKTTGACDSKGIYDTSASIDGGATSNNSNNSASINFWGLENWWGDLHEWVDNLNIANAGGLVNVLIPCSTTVSRTVQGSANGGCMVKAVIGTRGDMIKKAHVTQYFKGYNSYGHISATTNRVASRAYYGSDYMGGLGCLLLSASANYTNSMFGSRLQYQGDWEENNSLT